MIREYSIVSLTVEDAKELASLEAACFSMPWAQEQYEKILHDTVALPSYTEIHCLEGSQKIPCELPGPHIFGVRNAHGTLVAYLSIGLVPAAQELEVYNIAVHASVRTQGIGSFLLKHMLRVACLIGIERAFLEVRQHNKPAIALYTKFCFAICGHRKKYYADTGEDALVLVCDMGTVPFFYRVSG